MNDTDKIMVDPPIFDEDRSLDMLARGRMVKPTRQEVSRIEGRTLDRSGWYRASGAKVCDACQKEYWQHPYVYGYDWLHRICNGDFVKL